MRRTISCTIGYLLVLLSVMLLGPGSAVAAEELQVPLNKTTMLNLERAAEVVAVANPAIADVNVQSPTVIIVTGKAMGETSLNILDARKNRIASYELVVVPGARNQVTVNHGSHAVETLSCHPRCVRVDNPGKEPEPAKSGGAGGAVTGQLESTAGAKK